MKQRKTVNMAIAIAVVVHLALVLMAGRFQEPRLSELALYSGIALYFLLGPILWLWHRTTLPIRPQEGMTDIREAMAAASELEKYDPEPYFNPANGLFVGLDIDKQQPFYVPWNRFRKTHMQVVGATGFGKGVATTLMLSQCALDDECVIIFDPKFPGDEFAPRVLYRFATNHRIPFYLINLCPTMPPPFDKEFPETPPQLNLFRDCTQSQLEELLNTGFDLAPKGGNADHYRLHDRLACKDVCYHATANNNNPTVKDLVKAANKSRKITEEKGADFKANLQEMAALPVLHTAEGHDLKQILEQNAILYIIGSIGDPSVMRLQKMLLLRIMKIIEQRDRNKKLRPIALMLDELKYLLSRAALQALGTVRDKGCHILLAHQTNGDLRDCEGLDPEAVTAAVKRNTSLKLIYRAVDDDDAKWASNLSGTIIIEQESSHMQQGMFDAAEGQFRQAERPLLTPNHIYSLPDMTGMFFGYGLSRRVQVGKMQYGPQPTITPAKPLDDAKTQGKQSNDKKPAQEQNGVVKPAKAQEPALETITVTALRSSLAPQEPAQETKVTTQQTEDEKAPGAAESQLPDDINVEHLL